MTDNELALQKIDNYLEFVDYNSCYEWRTDIAQTCYTRLTAEALYNNIAANYNDVPAVIIVEDFIRKASQYEATDGSRESRFMWSVMHDTAIDILDWLLTEVEIEE